MKRYLAIALLFSVFLCNAQDSSAVKRNYIQFNLQAAVVANNAYSNYYQPAASTYTFSNYPGKNMGIGYHAGVEFLFGKKIKRVIMLTSEMTSSAYSYNSHTSDQSGYKSVYTNYETDTSSYKVTKRVNTFGLCGGLQLAITQKFQISPLVSIDYLYRIVAFTTGFDAVNHVPYTPVYTKTGTYDNAKTVRVGEGSGLVGSVKLRLSYELGPCISLYALANIGIKYVAPWYMLGVRWNPLGRMHVCSMKRQ